MSGRRWSTGGCAAGSTRATTAKTLPISPPGFGPTRALRVLVLNAGSSSLKLSLIDSDDRVLVDRGFEVAEGRLDESQLATTLHAMEGVEAIGHRVVHGGPRYRASVRIDPEVVRYLVTISDLAPLHLPAALSAIAAARELLPRVPGVACLDTAFHARMPDAASTYAVPQAWLQRHAGIAEPALTEALDRQGGLQALAGTSDMREILKRIADGDDRAELAFDVYIHRLRALIASMAAAMNGLDVLVFTGGVGENSSPVRSAAVAGLRFLGLAIGPTRNASLRGDSDISAPCAQVRTLAAKA